MSFQHGSLEISGNYESDKCTNRERRRATGHDHLSLPAPGIRLFDQTFRALLSDGCLNYNVLLGRVRRILRAIARPFLGVMSPRRTQVERKGVCIDEDSSPAGNEFVRRVYPVHSVNTPLWDPKPLSGFLDCDCRFVDGSTVEGWAMGNAFGLVHNCILHGARPDPKPVRTGPLAERNPRLSPQRRIRAGTRK